MSEKTPQNPNQPHVEYIGEAEMFDVEKRMQPFLLQPKGSDEAVTWLHTGSQAALVNGEERELAILMSARLNPETGEPDKQVLPLDAVRAMDAKIRQERQAQRPTTVESLGAFGVARVVERPEPVAEQYDPDSVENMRLTPELLAEHRARTGQNEQGIIDHVPGFERTEQAQPPTAEVARTERVKPIPEGSYVNMAHVRGVPGRQMIDGVDALGMVEGAKEALREQSQSAKESDEEQ